MGLLLAVLTALVLASAAPAQTQRTPRVWLVTAAPVTVGGAQFLARERVKVTAQLGTTKLVKTVTATSTGRFSARWTARVSDACYSTFIRATGSRGSTAVWKLVAADCAPPLEPKDPTKRS